MKIKFLLILLLWSGLTYSQEKKEVGATTTPVAQVFDSKQLVIIDGNTTNLNAKAGTMVLKDENNRPIALFGFTAYFKENAEKNRPIVFA